MRTRRGLTVLEVMIAGAILALVIVLALGLLRDTSEGVGDSLRMGDTAQRANGMVLDLYRELRPAGQFLLAGTALSPGGNFTSISYRPIAGFDFAATAPAFGRLRQIRFVYDAGEGGGGNGDNLDNDRDGLIDEGRLELLEDRNDDGNPTNDGVLAVLALDVLGGNAISFAFASGTAAPDLSQDREITVQFTIARRLPAQGQIHREPRTVRIGLRNSP